MDTIHKPLRDYKNRSYFIKLPNNPESAIFLKILRQHYKSPKYRIRVFPNGYGGRGETLRNTRAWRIYIHEAEKVDNLPPGIAQESRRYVWWRNIDVRGMVSLEDRIFELESRTTDGELEALCFIKKKYPEILMEWLLTK